MPYKIYGKSRYGGRHKPAVRKTKTAARKFAASQRSKGWLNVVIRKFSRIKRKRR